MNGMKNVIMKVIYYLNGPMVNLLLYAEAATGGVLQGKVFLEISQNSQENTCVSGLKLY